MTHSPYLDRAAGDVEELPACGGLHRQVHVFEADHVHAVNTAIAAGRPLLLRGEPGTGKSQLARAAAVAMRRAFVAKVIDARTEARDLLYTVDTVERLAQAQVLGALRAGDASVHELLDHAKFLRPGPLFWAFDWDEAKKYKLGREPAPPHPECDSKNGVVLLLDEIDKADVDVPNGLLEALGNGSFPVPDRADPIVAMTDPLVVVTTNEERALPDAFLRRCLVLQLGLPDDDAKLIEHLVKRGAAHFAKMKTTVLERAAELLVDDRRGVRERGLSPPGQAEYLDLLRALDKREKSEKKQLETLATIAKFAYRKHPDGEVR